MYGATTLDEFRQHIEKDAAGEPFNQFQWMSHRLQILFYFEGLKERYGHIMESRSPTTL